MAHHGVTHFEIPADDPEKLSQFYAELFGWKIDKFPMGDDAYYMTQTVEVDAEGRPKEAGAINGGIFKRQTPEQRAINYVNVESVDEYLEKARGLGARALTDKMPVPGMGYFAQFLDLEGNMFGVWEDNPSAS